MNAKIAKIAAALLLALALFSCDIGMSSSDKGSITMRLPDQSQLSGSASDDSLDGVSRSVSSGGSISAGTVDQFKVVVRNLSSQQNITQIVAPGSSVTIDDLEPGSWDVAIFGYDTAGTSGDPIYYGNARGIPVEGGETSSATVSLYKVEGNTRFDFTLSPDASGVATRSDVKKAYIIYSCSELGQSGTVFYDYSEPSGGDDPQPSDQDKIIIPVPDFLEPGYSCSAKVYLFANDTDGFKAVWNGNLSGKVQTGGTLSGDLAYMGTFLVKSTDTSTNKTYVRMDKTLTSELSNQMGYVFKTSGSSGTDIDYSSLEIFPAVADSCGDGVPLIVKYQDMLWTDIFEFKHLSALPSVTVPRLNAGNRVYVPAHVNRDLGVPTISPNAPAQFKVCSAASYDAYGFKKYFVSGFDTDIWSDSYLYNNETAKNVDFYAPRTVNPKNDGVADKFSCTIECTRGTYGYFDDNIAPLDNTKYVSLEFWVWGAEWTATGPGDVMLYSPFTITLESEYAIEADLDAVASAVTVQENSSSTPIAGVTATRSGSKVVISVPGQDTWNAGEQKSIDVKYGTNYLGDTVTVNIVQPTSGGGGSGGTSGSVPADFVLVPGDTISGQLGDPSGSATNLSSVFIADRTVTINDIYVCSHEVTQKEYSQYMMYIGEANSSYSSYQPQTEYGKGDNYPANYVGFFDAIAYCNARSKAEGLQPVYYIQKLEAYDTTIDYDHPTTSVPTVVETLTNVYDVNVWAEKLSDYFVKTYSYGNPETYYVRKYMTTDANGRHGFVNNSRIPTLYWVTEGVKMDTTKNGYRLLTEAEWEYCARGGKDLLYSIYSGTDDSTNLEQYAYYNQSYNGPSSEVKSKLPNNLGLYDMCGNVLEWCWDNCKSITSTTPATGVEATTNDDNISKVCRGGYWYGSCKIIDRVDYVVETRDKSLGFRICRNK